MFYDNYKSAYGEAHQFLNIITGTEK